MVKEEPAALATIAEEGLEEQDVGPILPKPKKRKVLEFESAHLDSLPNAEMYERSYMHRENLSHVAVAQATEFFITASVDGHIKFWKKKGEGVEFAKHFRAHLGPVKGLAVSRDGSLLVSISEDRSVKVFDVASLDLMTMLRLPFVPSCAEWIYKSGDAMTRLAIAEAESPRVHVYDVRSGSNEALEVVSLSHSQPVLHMRYNAPHDAVISVDAGGVIDYWSATTYKFPAMGVKFQYKLETDLYAMAKAKCQPTSLEVSRDGTQFAAFSTDRRVRVWRYATGALRRSYDESLEAAQELQRSDSPLFSLDPLDFGRRLAGERELVADPDAPGANAVFDDSGNFIIYPTLLGIKIVNLVTNRVARVVGRVENTERFLRVALFQGGASRKAVRLQPGREQPGAAGDPTILAMAYQRQRFYLFSRREPEDNQDSATGRDVFNERPNTDEMLGDGEGEGDGADSLPRGAVIHTSRGDIIVKLFPDECPRTVENFTTHASHGYYDGVIFHRVIKGFMIQTGDPLGDGTGGVSIWGEPFADELSRNLRHDRPFTLSMANSGPGTNGSQFFITTVPTPWLDNKHTVFGRVVKGADVVLNIERTKTDHEDSPVEQIKMINIDVKASVD